MPVCDSHREDQLLNPCTITGKSLLLDLKGFKDLHSCDLKR